MARILVVDDEQDLCEILRFNLEAEGFAVDTALSAEEALEKVGSYDLLLLDVMMGGMSGMDLARKLRGQGDQTPVIFLTALGDHDAQLEGFAAGADDYIAKPFAFDAVQARIRAVLRRSSQSNQSNQNIQSTQSTPIIPSAPADLTRREYLILQLFEQHPGRYFSREEILAAVWPGDALVGDRSVDVHIARLRKKLGADGSRIVNKTGFGYGLV